MVAPMPVAEPASETSEEQTTRRMVQLTRFRPTDAAALRRRLGQRFAQRLFDEFAHAPDSLATGLATGSKGLILAYACATLVYATSLALGAIGIAILVPPWTNMMGVFLGACLVVMCWFARPTPVEPPDHVIAPQEYPVLYSITRRMADRIGAPRVAGLAVSAEFGANYRAAGWHGARFIELGTPLLAVLSREEIVAVIAHELSHGANGDPMRSRFLSGAVHVLSNWAAGVRPNSIGRSADRTMFAGPIVSLIAVPFELAMLCLSEALLAACKAIVLLVLRQSQRAEYSADRLAATMAGTREMQTALEKTYRKDVIDAAIQRHALTSPDAPLRPSLRTASDAVTDLELSALRQKSRDESWQVDATHPPTALRVEMLARGPLRAAAVLFDESEGESFDAEIARLIRFNEREVVNRKLEAIYG